MTSSSYSITPSPWTRARWVSSWTRVSRLIAIPSLKRTPEGSTTTPRPEAWAGPGRVAASPSSSSNGFLAAEESRPARFTFRPITVLWTQLADLVDPLAPARPVVQVALPAEGPDELDAVARPAQDLEALDVRDHVQEGVDDLGGLAALGLGPEHGGAGEPAPGGPGVAQEVGQDGAAHHH